MGHLERYGLYVLCLVIFLILGVAIWGGDPELNEPDLGQSVASAGQSAGGTPLATERENEKAISDFMKRQAQDAARAQERAELSQAYGAAVKSAVRPAEGSSAKSPFTPAVKSERRKDEAPLLFHVVQKHDNLESISLQYLGKRSRWREILALNKGISERRLKLGTKLVIPARRGATGRSTVPASFSSSYKVRSGDSPAKIARIQLGSEKYAKDIMDLNNITDPRSLREGRIIKLPAVPK